MGSSHNQIDLPVESLSHFLHDVDYAGVKYHSRIFASFPDPAMVVNRDGRLVFLNRVAEDLLGFSLQSEEAGPFCREILKSGNA